MISVATASAQIALPLGIPQVSGTGSRGRVTGVSVPDRPDIDHPILSLVGGASAYMVVAVHENAPSTRIFAQYYDE